MKSVSLRFSYIVALGLVLSGLCVPRLSADENTPPSNDVIDMVAGDVETVPADNLTRVSVTNPEVADISDTQSDKVSLLAKKAGQTILFIWDNGGKRNIKVRVVNESLGEVKDRVQKLLDEANIKGLTLEENLDVGKVVIEGDLSKEDRSRLENLLEPYNDNLLNLVKEEKSEDLIQVDMQVVEISTTMEQNLGITWQNASGTNESTSTADGTASLPTGLALPYTETPPSTNGTIGDFFKIGNFNRSFQLQATVNALLQEGKARLISKPRLVVVSGKQASFLVGGEIPIQSTTTSASGGTQQTNVTYSQYGVNMTVTPTIHEGKIDVLLNVDIRDIDASTPINSSGNGDNVAFITRTAQTELLMDNKQTIVLAGLIKYEDNETVTEVPFLGKIPILGALFRNRSSGFPSPDTNTEMVIILTPTVLSDKKFVNSQLVMPTPGERDSWKEIDAKYEHEPLGTWPVQPPKAAVVQPQPQPDLSEIMLYARMIQEKISRAIIYPAMGNIMAGTVKLKLHILKDGSLDAEEVIESSGNSVLDQNALQAAKTAAPYDAFSTGMDQEGMVFTIPIVYNKHDQGNHAPAEKVIAAY